MSFSRLAIVVAVLALGASSQAQVVTKPGEVLRTSAVIQQIDYTSRIISYRTTDGKDDTMWAPPSLARFSELKVGDRMNLTYYESTAYEVRKPGAPPIVPSDKTSLTPTPGALPGGTIARQATASVIVKAVDPGVPSITVTTADNRTITRKVAQKSYLDGVKPGDRIDITYTEAVLASFERAK